MNEDTEYIDPGTSEGHQTSADDEGIDREFYVKLARDAHSEGQTFAEAGLHEGFRKNYAMAQSEHPEGSKYHTESFKHRSKGFRGKTEASLRKNEAAAAVAMFSNNDVVSISAENKKDEAQAETALNIHKLVNSRLDKHVKWFKLSIAAYREAMITGNILSEQYWDYDRDEEGNVLLDSPAVILYPAENAKISPYADWLDPVHSSPYVILELPMFVGDVKERMKTDWIPYDDSEIQTAAATYRHDLVKTAREGKKQTSAKAGTSVNITDFEQVFVHKNFIRHEGVDLFYFTLGTELLLSEPIPVQEAYPHLKPRKRPVVWGAVSIEAFKVYNRSQVDRGMGLQIELNEMSNSRRDNVRLVLNKRKYIQRNMGVDYAAMRKSIPGLSVLMDDINAVKEEPMSDVTASSYNEQNLLNADFDDASGTFSNGSVATNRALNETVGGMNMLTQNSNVLTEYQLRTFVESWVEEVVRQTVAMIVYYEDDEVIQKVLGDPSITNESLQVPVDVRVSVGFGSTDPQQKVQKMAFGINTVGALPGMAERLDSEYIATEMFGLLGFNDSSKFTKGDEEQEDPRIKQMMQQMQEMQEIIRTKQIEAQNAMAIEEKRGENSIYASIIKAKTDSKLKLTELAMSQGIKVAELEQKTGISSENTDMKLFAEINKMKELEFKRTSGRDGI